MTEPTKAEIMLDSVTKSNRLINYLRFCKEHPIPPDVVIKAGSKIIVTQHGRTTEYSNSGVPAVYPTHQEIMLTLFNGWA